MIVKGTGGDGQVLGNGCVYPTATASLPSELEASRLSWRAYVQGTNEGGSTPSGCVHPELGHSDPTSGPSPGSGTYSTFRNPFMYLASVTNASSAPSHMTGLSALGGDLASASRTPNFVYIIPDRCNDGNPNPCTPGASAGVKDSEGLLRRLVPQITGSPAFKQDGLLVITDRPGTFLGPLREIRARAVHRLCSPTSRRPKTAWSGGGSVGALLISPWVKGGSMTSESFNHFSLLKTINQLFGLRQTGYAGARGVPAFPPALFITRRSQRPLSVRHGLALVREAPDRPLQGPDQPRGRDVGEVDVQANVARREPARRAKQHRRDAAREKTRTGQSERRAAGAAAAADGPHRARMSAHQS